MNEKLIMLTLPLCAFLFMFGGYRQKVWRRYVLPVLLCGILIYVGVDIMRSIIFSVLTMGAFSMGYGDGSSWPKKALTFGSYSVPSAIFGFTIWQIINPFVFLLLFWVSKKGHIQWKGWEALIGLLFGVCLIEAIGG